MSEFDLDPPPLGELDYDRIAALDLSYDPDEPDPRWPTTEPPVFLPTLPEPQGPHWWAKLAMYAPTGYLLDELDELPVDELDAEQALQATVAAEQIIARAHAIQAKTIARFATLRPAPRGEPSSTWFPDIARYAPDELGCALGVSRHAAGRKLQLAHELTDRLPATLAALHGGRIDLGKAKVIADGTDVLETEQAHQVEQHVLQRAGHQTHPELRAATNRAVIRIDPKAAEQRRKRNVEDRNVELFAHPDGISDLSARLPSEVAAACYDRLSELAKQAKTPGDTRTADQRRADTFVDLLLGTKTGGGVQANILVLVRETSLLGVDDESGELVGTGPLPADVVRDIAQNPASVWRRLLTDAASGVVTDLGRTKYRPTTSLDELVKLRALSCYFPAAGTQPPDATPTTCKPIPKAARPATRISARPANTTTK